MQRAADTIAAIATPSGVGAIGVVRVSGSEAILLVNQIFPKKDLSKVKSHTLHFGPLEHDGILLDEVLISVFKNPHSYTGEDSIEISCHGSPFILQKVMETLMHIGIRPADPGEFTLRAFLNGKLDLAQAEAVADLIVSETEAAHQAALFQMRGGFSQKIRDLRERLLNFTSLIELELDFAEEFANRDHLNTLLNEIEFEVQKLAESFSLGNVIKAGVNIVIAGRPNAGKSTLLNAILNEERAIVSDIPGTTRDTVEDTITVEGIRFRFIDTAGIRSSEDVLENIGIGRTMDKLKEAQIIIYLYDVNSLSPEELQADLDSLPEGKEIVVAGNKVDQQLSSGQVSGNSPFKGGRGDDNKGANQYQPVFISAKNGLYIEELKSELVRRLHLNAKRTDDTVVTNIRHYHSLKRILFSIQSIKGGLAAGMTSDLLVVDIRQALHDMGEITGEITTDEILGNIFGKFCIGK